MKDPGKLYIDVKEGVKGWFGMFLETQQGYNNFINDVWRWQVINSSIVINYQKINNYYNRREATLEEIEEIHSILENLHYTIDKKLGGLIKNIDPISDIVSKLKENREFSNINRVFLINYIEKHERRNL